MANEDRVEERRTMEINKDGGIKKTMEEQVPATKDILQLDHNLLTPTEIEAFKMIDLAHIENKDLTHDFFVEGAYHRTQRHYLQIGGSLTLDV